MHIISKYNDISPDEWNDLIQSSQTATYFQTKACYDFYASLSFLKPFVFAVRDDRKLLALVVGYIIADGNLFKKFFSRRAIIPGGMLIHNKADKSAIELLLKHVNKYLKSKAIYAEFRNYNDFDGFKTSFEQSGFKYQAHLNFHVDTTNYEIAHKNLTASKQRDIKTSFKNGAEVVIASNETEVKSYFELLENLYKTKIKTPLFPLEFFIKLFKTEMGLFLLVKYEGEIIGGSVCVRLPGQTLFEWFVCGLDGQFKGVFPSTLATWACIEYAAHYGFKRFDMMGAGKPEEGYGVRNFKSKFGGELVEHGRFLHVYNPLLFNLGKSIVKYLKNRK